MNIPQILENLGENRADFIEALADASHYLWTAIDLLDPIDQVTLRALLGARDAIDEVLGACEAETDDDDSDADDDAGDKALQEAYDIIAADDDADSDAKEMTISQMLKDQWANEKLVGRGWN